MRATVGAVAMAALVAACSPSPDADDPAASATTGATVPVAGEAPATIAAPGTTADASTDPAPVPVAWPPASLEALEGRVLDGAEIAAALTEAERTLRDPAVGAAAAEQAGVRQQLLFRELANRTELDEAVIAAVGDDVRPTIERVLRARQFVQQRAAARAAEQGAPTPPSPTLPAWTIVEPEPIEVLRAHYLEAEALTGVPWYWLAAIHLQETRMGRIVGVSSAGAVGPMQFLPSTWAGCCAGDPWNTRDAIIGAATYLVDRGGPGDMAAAVYGYNPNEGYVALVTAYAENLRDVPGLLAGYHAWQVFSGSVAGTIRLPVGYSSPEPVDAAAYLAANPADLAWPPDD